jgi:hypothetical protein
MKHQNRLSNQEQEQQEQQVAQNQAQAVQEFASVEEMLRHDALHTPVPPGIAERLGQSLGPVAPPAKSWWRRIFGKE